jgi:ABC-type Zn uptake system ZnuABC Zn-binding protein ZnuA
MRARALTGLALANASLVAGCGVSATRTVTRTAVAAPVVITVNGPLQARDISGNSVAVTGTVDPSDATVDVAG